MYVLAGLGPLGPTELIIILVIVLLLFGANRVGDLGSSLGKGIKEFRKNVRDDEEPKPTAVETPPPAPAAATADPMTAGQTIAATRCPSCGTLNPVSAKHCSQCGAALAAPVS